MLESRSRSKHSAITRKALGFFGYASHILAKMWLRFSYNNGEIPLAVVKEARHGEITHREVSTPTVTAARRFLRKNKNTTSEYSNKVKAPRRKLQHTVVLSAMNTLAISAIAIGLTFSKFKESTPTVNPVATENTPSQSTQSRYLPIIPIVKTQPVTVDESKKSHRTALSAWIAPWNVTDLTSQASGLKSASAFWGTVGTDGYTITSKASFDSWRTFKAALPAGAKTYLTINGDPNNTYQTISNVRIREQFIANALLLAKQEGFDGIDIDFEALGSDNRVIFSDFLRSVLSAFKPQGILLGVTLEARIANQVPMDWQAIGQIADSVRIMAYDYHSQSTSIPGPVAPIGWFEEVARYAAVLIPQEKLSIGVPNYGYAWTQPTDPNGSWIGQGIGYSRAVSLAQEKGVEIIRKDGIDERGYLLGSSPSFTYLDETGKTVQVWFEDATSLSEKLSITDQFSKLDAAILWSIGPGDSKLWEARQ